MDFPEGKDIFPVFGTRPSTLRSTECLPRGGRDPGTGGAEVTRRETRRGEIYPLPVTLEVTYLCLNFPVNLT